MPQIVFDPESEVRPNRSFGRIEMRSASLLAKQARASSEVRRKAEIAAAERDRKAREARIRQLAEAAAAARMEMAAKRDAMREQALAESVAEIECLIRDKLRSRQAIRMAIIEYRAVRLFRVTLEELHRPCRRRNPALARQFVMYWAARLTALSWGQIGQRMGGADHSTIFYGSRSYANKRNAMGRGLRAARPLSQKKQEVEA